MISLLTNSLQRYCTNLLGSEHQDGENQSSSNEHLDEYPLSSVYVWLERRATWLYSDSAPTIV